MNASKFELEKEIALLFYSNYKQTNTPSSPFSLHLLVPFFSLSKETKKGFFLKEHNQLDFGTTLDDSWLEKPPNAMLFYGNDPSAGSPTETLLRLLLPLNNQV